MSHDPERDGVPPGGADAEDHGPDPEQGRESGSRERVGEQEEAFFDSAVPGGGHRSRDEAFRRRVTNIFYGTVNANEATFGTADASADGPRARTTGDGRLLPREIEEAVGRYVHPGGFGRAFDLLTEHRVLILSGRPGGGRRAGAIRLLTELGVDEILLLPPGRTPDELSREAFRSGCGYIVLDWFGADSAGSRAEHEYTWSLVRERVRDRSAHLILTCAPSLRIGALAPRTDLGRPDTGAVLREHAGDGVPAEEVAAAAEAIPADRSIADLVDVAGRLADGEPAESAVDAVLHSSSRERVKRWFDTDPDRRAIAGVTALALAEGLHERDHEMLAKRLHARLPKVAERTGSLVTAAAPEPVPDRLPEDCLRRGGDDLLIRVEYRDDGRFPRRHPVFREPGDRAVVLRFLWERYDVDFWDAVRVWTGDVLSQPRPQRQVALGRGLSALAATAFEEVHDLYLERWSLRGGVVGRQTCVFVLWAMCLDGMAATVLRTVGRWIAHGTDAQAELGLRVWSGELGVTYPLEAVNRLIAMLCDTEERPERRMEAAFSLGALFGSLIDREANARILVTGLHRTLTEMPRFGRHRLERRFLLMAVVNAFSAVTSEPILDEGAIDDEGENGAEPGEQSPENRATGAGAEAERSDRSEPEEPRGDTAIARHVVLAPDQIPKVAVLWAEILRFRTARPVVIEALLLTVRSLQRGGGEAQERARELLRETAANLPAEERQGLRTTLSDAVRRHGDKELTLALMDLLTGVFGEGGTPPGTRGDSGTGQFRKAMRV
ncbi:hypothetical protein SUDANB121_02947 [Nocardiopsis dassonvillei]|uniref:hypothetical protein n=1 Tax=Nocardiopsis dassonvillei TaxID=2014 RepID=UPI003F57EF8F